MKWLLVKPLILALPFVAVTSTAAAKYGSMEAVITECQGAKIKETVANEGGG